MHSLSSCGVLQYGERFFTQVLELYTVEADALAALSDPDASLAACQLRLHCLRVPKRRRTRHVGPCVCGGPRVRANTGIHTRACARQNAYPETGDAHVKARAYTNATRADLPHLSAVVQGRAGQSAGMRAVGGGAGGAGDGAGGTGTCTRPLAESVWAGRAIHTALHVLPAPRAGLQPWARGSPTTAPG